MNDSIAYPSRSHPCGRARSTVADGGGRGASKTTRKIFPTSRRSEEQESGEADPGTSGNEEQRGPSDRDVAPAGVQPELDFNPGLPPAAVLEDEHERAQERVLSEMFEDDARRYADLSFNEPLLLDRTLTKRQQAEAANERARAYAAAVWGHHAWYTGNRDTGPVGRPTLEAGPENAPTGAGEAPQEHRARHGERGARDREPAGPTRPGAPSPEKHGIGPGSGPGSETLIGHDDAEEPVEVAEALSENLVHFPGRRRTGGGHLVTKQAVRREQADFARGLMAGHSEESRGLWLHVLWCQASRPWAYADGVPVAWNLICPSGASTEPVWEPLVEDGLLSVSEYSHARHRSRVYRVPDEIIDGFLNAARLTPGPRADLFTGKVTTRREKTIFYDEARNPVAGPLFKRAMKLIKYDIVNLDRGRAHVEALERAYEAARAALEAAGGHEYVQPIRALVASAGGVSQSVLEALVADYEEENGEPRTAEWLACRKAMLRWRNDKAALDSVMDLGPQPTSAAGVYLYKPAYEPQRSGRATASRGQTQNASREMQHELRDGLEDVRNYDYKSSQPVLLVELIAEANRHPSAPGLSSVWLERYVNNPQAKTAYALRAGVSVDTWKTVLCADLMGASLPRTLGKNEGAISAAVRAEVPDPADRIATWARLRDVLDELHTSLKAWHEWIDTVYARDPAFSGPNPKGGRSVRNAVGHAYHWRQETPTWKRKAELAAFLLQGKEAQLVLNLIALGPAYGYDTLAHMHDGIITHGEVPADAVERASQLAGIVRADLVELVEKPYK